MLYICCVENRFSIYYVFYNECFIIFKNVVYDEF